MPIASASAWREVRSQLTGQQGGGKHEVRAQHPAVNAEQRRGLSGNAYE